MLGALLLAPFIVLMGIAAVKLSQLHFSSFTAVLTAPPPKGGDNGSLWVAGVLLCMWNYMGWDNTSTVAADVDRPQRIWLDPDGRIVIADKTQLSILFPTGRIPRSTLSLIPANELDEQ